MIIYQNSSCKAYTNILPNIYHKNKKIKFTSLYIFALILYHFILLRSIVIKCDTYNVQTIMHHMLKNCLKYML